MMDNKSITSDEFILELLSAVCVCFEGNAERLDDVIVYTAPNGQKFRIKADSIS